MSTLKELLGSGDKRRAVIDDACRVLDAEVADKGGITGLAIKGAYGMVKGIKPGFVPEVVDHLLDDFLETIEPIYQEAKSGNIPPKQHLVTNSGRMAEGLLAVTDQRAERAQRAVIKKAYVKLRPTAKKHVEAAAPRLGEMLERHTGD